MLLYQTITFKNKKMSTLTQGRVAIVGGGLVGTVQACLLAKRGIKVDVYEQRGDIRHVEHGEGKSINLTLSERGRKALREIGIEDTVLEKTVPVHSRLIHAASGKLSTQPYGTNGENLYSINRLKLNKLLLDEAERTPNVTLHFQHHLIKIDLTKKELTFRQTNNNNNEIVVQRDFIFGCDGAFSSVRQQMMRWGKMDFAQVYVKHGYKEFRVPPVNGQFAMEESFLHIWPRNNFMMIGLPNTDRSFTLTLFMPFENFQSIETKEQLLAFFTQHFPDLVPKIGKDNLIQDYSNNPTGSLVSMKCNPHFMADSTVILGDAAHAVVPFYGQGVNAGFEDCYIFYKFLKKTGNDLIMSAEEYSLTHWKDSHAIADLSMNNYAQLCSHITDRTFLIRRHIDAILHFLLPTIFIPMYTMVSFSDIPYAEVVKRNQQQQKVVNAGFIFLLLVVLIILYIFYVCI